MPIMHLLIPGACPELPTGPCPLLDGGLSDYVAEHGALPPDLGEGRREEFEACRDDHVLMAHRTPVTKRQYENCRTWLRRHGLDLRGRPLIWQNAGHDVNTLALAG